MKFDLIFGESKGGQNTGAGHHEFEEVVAVQDVLEGVLEKTLRQGLENYGEASVGFAGKICF